MYENASIHGDSFEFPARLKLDQYLAPNAPETSREHPNTYLLHSVLVHQGDVGGGHYYAYIRPGAGFDETSSSDKAAGGVGAGGEGGGGGGGGSIAGRFNYADVAARGLGLEAATAATSSSSAAAAAASQSNEPPLHNHNHHNHPPSTQDLLEKSARKGQWFKFNDETVMKVPPREAINLCYGRDPKALNSFWGVGSAYMLVYIRESDVARVMQPMRDSDIPKELTDRLDR